MMLDEVGVRLAALSHSSHVLIGPRYIVSLFTFVPRPRPRRSRQSSVLFCVTCPVFSAPCQAGLQLDDAILGYTRLLDHVSPENWFKQMPTLIIRIR